MPVSRRVRASDLQVEELHAQNLPPCLHQSDPLLCGRRTAVVLATITSVLVLAVYVFTLPPTVVGGDSGEIVVAAWKLVYAHPPGYPLITLVGHVFCHYMLPLGEPAWRMGVLNAVFGAITAALLVLLTQQLTGCMVSLAATQTN